MKKIVVVGSSNTDMVIKSSKLPAAGETIIGHSFLMNAGGKGANQAVSAARLGGNVVFICRVGNDIFGKQAIDGFMKENIDTKYISIDENLASGIALINVDSKGENSISVALGANGNLSKSDIDFAGDCFKPNNILLVQLETPIETVAYAIRKAKDAGMITILNPAPAARLSDDIFPFIDYITPNETETEILTNLKIIDLKSVSDSAEILFEKGTKNVIITLGSEGAFVKSNNFEGNIKSPKVIAKDTTAAGDCFNGALAVAISENKSIREAVSFACKAASVSVTKVGAQTSMPFRNEILH